MQRAAPLAYLPELLSEHGTPLTAVLDVTGIAPDDLRADALIPFARAVSGLEKAALPTGQDVIGLRLGLRRTLASLSPVGEVMGHRQVDSVSVWGRSPITVHVVKVGQCKKGLATEG